jgi:hypothetical protein
MYEALYERGIAVGESDIRHDEMHFSYRKEKFTFPTMKVYRYVDFNGYFYTASVDKLRELEREASATH